MGTIKFCITEQPNNAKTVPDTQCDIDYQVQDESVDYIMILFQTETDDTRDSSSRDKESIKMKSSHLNAMQPQSEDEEDQLEALARSHGYDVEDHDSQVLTLNSLHSFQNPKHELSEKDSEIEIDNRANYIQPIPSQILTVYDKINIIHLLMINFIRT